MNSPMTTLERAVLQLVADHSWPHFSVESVDVVRREHTGVGRYTYLVDHAKQSIPDGTYGAAAHVIQMEGVPNGLFFVVEVSGDRVLYIEIVSCGGETWDGSERSWTIA